MPVRRLASNPSLDHLKHQAKDLLKEHSARLPETAQKIREFHPRFPHASDSEIFAATLRLSDAQLTIAREHGFASWARLKRHIERPSPSGNLDLPHHERIEDPAFRRAVELIDAGKPLELHALLQQDPKLVHQRLLFEGSNYFRTPTLLEFIAENPVRHGTLPANIVEVARVLLDAGPDLASRNETLMLVATGSVPRQCGVQLPLIDLLCEHGADLAPAMRAAAVLEEHDAARALIRHGARVDLPVAAALGLTAEFRALLPTSTPEDRHLALSTAANFGHLDIVRSLLDAGVDPNRYNPPGGHSHATPLHQAAGFGHEAVVRLLVDRGARLDMKDVLWHATPAEWAAHQGKSAIAAYLRDRQTQISLKPDHSGKT